MIIIYEPMLIIFNKTIRKVLYDNILSTFHRKKKREKTEKNIIITC